MLREGRVDKSKCVTNDSDVTARQLFILGFYFICYIVLIRIKEALRRTCTESNVPSKCHKQII